MKSRKPSTTPSNGQPPRSAPDDTGSAVPPATGGGSGSLPMRLIGRAAALERGLTRYFTGKPCKHDHVAERSMMYGRCVVCVKESSIKRNQDPVVNAKKNEKERKRYHDDHVVKEMTRKRARKNRELRKFATPQAAAGAGMMAWVEQVRAAVAARLGRDVVALLDCDQRINICVLFPENKSGARRLYAQIGACTVDEAVESLVEYCEQVVNYAEREVPA